MFLKVGMLLLIIIKVEAYASTMQVYSEPLLVVLD